MISILLIGLDNSGKSTLISHAKPLPSDGIIEIVPTMGFSIEEIQMPSGGKGIIYDCSGSARYRNMWDHFVGEIQGVIYVIDSADRSRLSIAKKNIEEFFKHPLLKKKPIVFLANKQDMPEALSKEDVKRVLSIDKKSISNPFSVKPAISATGMGLNNSLSFIESNLLTNKLEYHLKPL